jgi:hypothetical protein
MMPQERMLARPSRTSTAKATGPLLWIISTRAVVPELMGGAAAAVVSSWRNESAKDQSIVSISPDFSVLRCFVVWSEPKSVEEISWVVELDALGGTFGLVSPLPP